MLTGQETITDILKNYPHAKAAMYEFGFTEAAEQHFRYRNLAHAAVITKIPLRKILENLAQITGEKFAEPKVSGIPVMPNSTLRHGRPSGIKKVIGVHSGKGGVGKTFIAVNLAIVLAKKGFNVGLLDADIDCPNIMKMLNLKGKLIANKNQKIIPLQKFGIKIVSMAPLLVNEEDVLLWRGPIVSRVVEQFLFDVFWGELDYLIVDLPPGTSDIPLTFFQIVKDATLLLITTPQELALLDTKKSSHMARKMGIKIIGLVENMSGPVFGSGKAKKTAKSMGIPFLGSIELKKTYNDYLKNGQPVVLSSSVLKNHFESIIKKINDA